MTVVRRVSYGKSKIIYSVTLNIVMYCETCVSVKLFIEMPSGDLIGLLVITQSK